MPNATDGTLGSQSEQGCLDRRTYRKWVVQFFPELQCCTRPICVDEATEFLRRTILNKGRKGLLAMSRVCKLYDGDSWNVIGGAKGKRKGVNEARCAFLAEQDWREPNKASGRIWRTSIT